MKSLNLRRLVPAGLCLVLAMPALMPSNLYAQAASAGDGKTLSPAESLDAVLSLMEKQIVSAADAMPADKFDFAPNVPGGDFKGVNTFSKQVKHLAEANYGFFQGWNIPGAVDPKTIDAMTSKDDIMKALKDSYAYAHAAVHSITAENAFVQLPGGEKRKATRVSNATFCMAHSMDHYGQIVEYLRMNSIIPPASRK